MSILSIGTNPENGSLQDADSDHIAADAVLLRDSMVPPTFSGWVFGSRAEVPLSTIRGVTKRLQELGDGSSREFCSMTWYLTSEISDMSAPEWDSDTRILIM